MGTSHPLGVLALLCALSISTAAFAPHPRLQMHQITHEGLGVAPPAGVAANREPERYSGYFKLNRTYDANMFFFFFEARENRDDAPVVLWMTGGPGCSSELAVFYENGPWTLDADLNPVETEYGWDRAAHMIYVDQPIGTGFSYSDDDRDRCYDEDCVADDMLDFLEALWAARPDLAGRDFFVTGESYAGHYVPAVSSRVYHAVKNGETQADIRLKGLAIGNGLTAPSIQYGAYADFAADNGLITSDLRDQLNEMYPSCRVALQVCDGLGVAAECLAAVMYCQTVTFAPIMLLNPGMNVYDYRKRCEGALCYDFSRMEEYLNRADVRKALGVGDREWEACNMDVHQDMMSDWGHSFDGVLPEMLADGVQVLVYAGDKDFICNVLGNRRWVDALQWEHWREFVSAPNVTWTVGDADAGTVTSVGPLTFLSIKDAGHMVPMDKPREALEMLTKWMAGEDLAGGSAAPGARVMPKGDAGAVLRAGRRGGAGFDQRADQ